jgi:transcriptional regulator with XRE-family HTH domain
MVVDRHGWGKIRRDVFTARGSFMSPAKDQGLPRRFVDSIGVKLRTIRQQLQFSLREVEERSLRFAQEQGDQSYQVSASWLARLEREDHELTVNKLIALATRTEATFQSERDDVVSGRSAGRAGKISDSGYAYSRAAG